MEKKEDENSISIYLAKQGLDLKKNVKSETFVSGKICRKKIQIQGKIY